MTVLHNIDLEEVKFKLYERLKPSGWGDKLKTFILSDEFDKILLFLLKDAKKVDDLLLYLNKYSDALKSVLMIILKL